MISFPFNIFQMQGEKLYCSNIVITHPDLALPCSAKDFPAKAVLKLSASLRVLMLYSRVSCRTNSKPFEACSSVFTPTSALHRLIPSLKRIDQRQSSWMVPKCTPKNIANNLRLRASGHLQACSISLPNSKLA